MGAPADMPGVWTDIVLRRLAKPETRNKARSCHEPPGDRLCGVGRTVAVLLPGRGFCGVLKRVCQSLFLSPDHEPLNPNRGFI